MLKSCRNGYELSIDNVIYVFNSDGVYMPRTIIHMMVLIFVLCFMYLFKDIYIHKVFLLHIFKYNVIQYKYTYIINIHTYKNMKYARRNKIHIANFQRTH